MSTVIAIILTKNEELHLARCIESIKDSVDRIAVVDSGSTDRTQEIAAAYGAEFTFRPWINHATQLNHAIATYSGQSEWLLRVDADEVLEPANKPNGATSSLRDMLATASSTTDGLLVQRRIHFLGRRIKFGAIEPSWQLRLWRNGRGRCEQRWMDEHVLVEGDVARCDLVLSDINLNPLHWWIEKHNSYASREAIDQLNAKHHFLSSDDLTPQAPSSRQARLRRFLKTKVYQRLPGGLRSSLYFFYRYVLRLGFLDGWAGFYFHVLQAFWYRTLVDAKVYDIERWHKASGDEIVKVIQEQTGLDPLAGSSFAHKVEDETAGPRG